MGSIHFLIKYFNNINILLLAITSLSYPQMYFTEVAEEYGVFGPPKWNHNETHWIDYDNDNDLDLHSPIHSFAINPYTPNVDSLYNNIIEDSIFISVAPDVGLTNTDGLSYYHTWGDFNQDGWIDCYVINGAGSWGAPDVPPHLYLNLIGLYFEEQGQEWGLEMRAYDIRSCTGDYDGDGDLDIYVSSRSGGPNQLLKNEGDHFVDVANELSVAIADTVYYNGGSTAMVDFDNDGDLDISFLPWNGTFILFQNNLDSSGSFEYISNDVGFDEILMVSSFSYDWGDFDNDGDLDLVIAISYQEDFYAVGSKIIENRYNEIGQFIDITDSVDFIRRHTDDEVAWADFDNDGDLDIIICRYDTRQNDKNSMYRNDYNISGVFVDVTDEWGLESDTISNAGGGSVGDFDNDGDLDLYLTTAYIGGRPGNYLYRNELNNNNSLFVRFLTANGSKARHGSKVEVFVENSDTLVGMRNIGSIGNHITKAYDAHFGLNPNQSYDIKISSTVRINGENNIYDKFSNPELGGVIPADLTNNTLVFYDSVNTVLENGKDINSLFVDRFSLSQNFPNPFNSHTKIPFFIAFDADIIISIIDITGKHIKTLINSHVKSGHNYVFWDGKNDNGLPTPSGLYFCQLKLTNKRKLNTIKMLQIK